jgi:glycosyltransferase involved in cell wall biosynthesis
VARLLVLSPRELTGDSRARRQVLAGVARGWEVLGLCLHLPGEDEATLAGIRIVRVRGGRVSDRLRSAGLGGMRRSRPLVRELRGLFRLGRLGGTTRRLAHAGRRLGPLDVVHANDFDALPAGRLIARHAGAKLVYDAHELYSEMEPDPPRLYRAIASKLERALGRRAATVVTNCDLFAQELDRMLQLERSSVVVLNCPERIDQVLPQEPGPRLRVIYQAAGSHAGRPVEDLLTAAEHAPEVEITIRLLEIDAKALAGEVARRGLAGRVHMVPPVAVDEAVEALVGYDVGVTIDRPLTPNTELSVPGKLFEYMMAGLALVVPRLPGVAALVEGERVGLTFEPGRPEDLGRALSQLAADRGDVTRMQSRARLLALERFNAETQAEVLAGVWSH